MNRPAGRVRGVSKCRGSGRVGSMCFKISRVGSGQELLKSCGSGRVGSGRDVSKYSRVGSGHDPPDTGHSRVKPPWPVGCFWLTRGSNPRIWPADSPFSHLLTAACRRVLVVPAPRGSDPRIRPAGPKMIHNLSLPA